MKRGTLERWKEYFCLVTLGEIILWNLFGGKYEEGESAARLYIIGIVGGGGWELVVNKSRIEWSG